jgi:hypothetical protein
LERENIPALPPSGMPEWVSSTISEHERKVKDTQQEIMSYRQQMLDLTLDA